ncbi:MAG: transglutaminase domain-containing protein, partial [Endomicrobiia bacterium]
ISVNVSPEDKINSIIRVRQGYENQFYPTSNVYDKYTYLDALMNEVESDNKTHYEIAKYIYVNILKKFKVIDYSFNENTTNQLSDGKYEVNIAELNYIYRYLLNKFGIDSRGVFGYVFPVQPLKRDSYNTYQHIWTEFWDGEKWIIVDPAWYLSSGGTIYFDNNNFHHIKFGDYQQESDLISFLNQRKYISLTPLNNPSSINNQNTDFNINIDNYINLNRELMVEFKNPTNQFVKVNIIDILSESESVTPEKGTFSQKILAPRSNLKYSIPFDYGLVLLDKNIKLDMHIKYNMFENESLTKIYKVTVNLRSNISGYMSLIFAYGFILVSFLTIGALTIYKRQTMHV